MSFFLRPATNSARRLLYKENERFVPTESIVLIYYGVLTLYSSIIFRTTLYVESQGCCKTNIFHQKRLGLQLSHRHQGNTKDFLDTSEYRYPSSQSCAFCHSYKDRVEEPVILLLLLCKN